MKISLTPIPQKFNYICKAMQADIITENANVLKSESRQIITIANEATDIQFQIVIKFAGIEKLYTVKSEVKHIKGQPEIKTRLE